MDQEINNRSNLRITTLPIIALLGIVIFLVRTFVLPTWVDDQDWASSLYAIMDNLVAATIISIGAGATVLVLTRNSRGVKPHLAKGRSLKSMLKSDSNSSDLWRVRARTGSYFVRETLPGLAENRGHSIKVILMNPSLSADLATYEDLKFKTSNGDWSSARISADIVSSIIRIFQIHAQYKRLDIAVSVASAGWVQSLDISSSRAFLCGQDRGDLALVTPRNHELYDRFCDDFEAASKLAKPITMPEVTRTKLGSHLEPITVTTLRTVKKYFVDEIGIDLNDETSQLWKLIIARSKGNHHYG